MSGEKEIPKRPERGWKPRRLTDKLLYAACGLLVVLAVVTLSNSNLKFRYGDMDVSLSQTMKDAAEIVEMLKIEQANSALMLEQLEIVRGDLVAAIANLEVCTNDLNMCRLQAIAPKLP